MWVMAFRHTQLLAQFLFKENLKKTDRLGKHCIRVDRPGHTQLADVAAELLTTRILVRLTARLTSRR